MKAKCRARKSPSLIAKSAILLMGSAFFANAFAANNMPTGCNEVSLTPQDLEIPATTLIANKTDHVLVPATNANEELADEAEVDPQSIAPILSLTPRVLNILDQVFATDTMAPAESDSETSESASPVADSDSSQSEKKESVEESPLPQRQIQSQMYRKDI